MNYYNVFFYGNNEPKVVVGHSLDTVMNEFTEMYGDDTIDRVEPVSIHQTEKAVTQGVAKVSVLTGYNPFAGRLSEAEEAPKPKKKEDKKEEKEANYHLRERYYGTFQRSISLPSNIESDKIEASFQHGVLHILVPKSNGKNSKKIEIR